MWSRRAQEYEQKINSGKIYELAEVVRDLNKDTDVIAEQSYSERLLFEKAYERLLSEFTIVLKIGQEKTQKNTGPKTTPGNPRTTLYPQRTCAGFEIIGKASGDRPLQILNPTLITPARRRR